MALTDYTTIIAVSAAITTVGGAWLTIRKIAKDAKKERKEQAAEILKEATEADALLKAKLEARIEAFRVELKNLEFNVNKDLEHMKETQKSEIRVLGEKLQELRDELRNQHGQLVLLLTEMVKKG